MDTKNGLCFIGFLCLGLKRNINRMYLICLSDKKKNVAFALQLKLCTAFVDETQAMFVSLMYVGRKFHVILTDKIIFT